MRTSVKLAAGDRGHFAFIAEVLKAYDDLDKSALSKQELETLRQITRMLNQAMAAASQSMEAQTGLIRLTKSVGALAASLGANGTAKIAGEKAKEVRENARDVQRDIGAVLQQLGSMKDDTGLKQTLLNSMNQLKDMEPKGKEGSRVVRHMTLRGDKPAAMPANDIKDGVEGATILPFALKNISVDTKTVAGPVSVAFAAAHDKVFSNPVALAVSKLTQSSLPPVGILSDNKIATGVPAAAVGVSQNYNTSPALSQAALLQTSVSQAALSQMLASQTIVSPASLPSVGMSQSYAPAASTWSQPSAPPPSQPSATPPSQPTSQPAASQPSTSEPAAKAYENKAQSAADAKEVEKRPEQILQSQPILLPIPMLQGVSSQSAGADATATTQQPITPASRPPAEAKAEEKQVITQNDNPISRPIVTLVAGPVLGDGDTSATSNMQSAPAQQPISLPTNREQHNPIAAVAPASNVEPAKPAVGLASAGAGSPVSGHTDNPQQNARETVTFSMGSEPRDLGDRDQNREKNKSPTSPSEKVPASREANPAVVLSEKNVPPIKQEAVLAGCAACGRCTDGSGCKRPPEVTVNKASMNNKFNKG